MSQSYAEKLRRRLSAKNVTAILVFGAIILVFVFFGMPDKMGMGIGSVARVNETLISFADFQREEQRVQKMQEYYAQMLGQPMPTDPQRQKDIRRQAVQTLVNTELMSQAGHAQGLKATNMEIIDQLHQIPEFQQEGRFKSDLYFRLLEANRLSPSEFEKGVRKQVEQMRLQKVFAIAAAPTQLELEQQKVFKENKWNVAFVRISTNENDKITKEQELEAKSSLENSDFSKRVEAEYKANIQKYNEKEQVKAQHILIGFKPGDKASEQKALEKIKEIKARAESEDFGKIAAELSEDPGSKAKKGDLGFFTRGKMVPEFEQVAFSSPVGVVSEPVRSPYGYHLIKVNEKSGSGFEEFKVKIAAMLVKRDHLEKKMKNLEDHLAQGQEAALNAELKSLGLTWEETGFFELGSEVIPKLSGENISSAVFQLSRTQPISKQIIRSGGERYILKLKDTKKESVAAKDIDAEKDSFKQRRAMQMLESWVENYRKNSKIEVNEQVISQ